MLYALVKRLHEACEVINNDIEVKVQVEFVLTSVNTEKETIKDL